MTPLSQYLMIGKLAALLGAVAIICWQSSQIHRWHKHYESEHTARLADRAAYERAQKQADAQNKADIQRTEQRQKEISDATVANLNTRIAELRRVLAQPRAAQSHPGEPNLSTVPDAAQPASGEAGVCLTPEQLLRAAENEERHDQLIHWIEQQLTINPNKP
jgi:hypothetical protein